MQAGLYLRMRSTLVTAYLVTSGHVLCDCLTRQQREGLEGERSVAEGTASPPVP